MMILKKIIVFSICCLSLLSIPQSIYAADGQLDPTFGTNGIVTTAVGTANDVALAIAIDSQGRIIAAGYGNNPLDGHSDFALTRYNPDGTLDTSFGTQGKVTTSIAPFYDDARALVIDSQDRIVIAGTSQDIANSSLNFALARYTSNGTLDSTFGNGGIVTTQLNNLESIAATVVIDSQNRIIAAGQNGSGSSDTDFALVRYLPDGSVDTSFGTNGIVIAPIGNGSAAITSAVVDSQDKIVVAGYSNQGNLITPDNDFTLVRYNADGSLDASFGTNGIVTTSFTDFDIATSVVKDASGRFVVAGATSSNSTIPSFALSRYTTNGTIDTSFGTNGKVTTAVGTVASSATDVAIDSQGKIVVVGGAINDTTNDFGLVRYNTNGSLDSSFGSGGKVVTSLGSGADTAYGVAVQNDDKVIAVGSSFNGSDDDFALARYGGMQPTPTPLPYPTTKAECQNGGWMHFTNPTFKNQGQCIKYVNAH